MPPEPATALPFITVSPLWGASWVRIPAASAPTPRRTPATPASTPGVRGSAERPPARRTPMASAHPPAAGTPRPRPAPTTTTEHLPPVDTDPVTIHHDPANAQGFVAAIRNERIPDRHAVALDVDPPPAKPIATVAAKRTEQPETGARGGGAGSVVLLPGRLLSIPRVGHVRLWRHIIHVVAGEREVHADSDAARTEEAIVPLADGGFYGLAALGSVDIDGRPDLVQLGFGVDPAG